MKDFTKSHTSLTVIIVAALLIELTTGFIYYNSQDIIKRTTVRVMERENIARGKQTLLAHLLDPLRQIARILAGAGTDFHAKLAGDVGNFHADIAQSHDTQGLAGKLHQWGIPITEIRVLAP